MQHSPSLLLNISKPEDLENYADRFGFGAQLPLEIDVPLGQFHSEVDPLNFARAATGFRGSTLSPLGAAYLAYVIASDGRALPLQLLDAERSPSVSTADAICGYPTRNRQRANAHDGGDGETRHLLARLSR